ncbi:transketolase, partial [Candidatus Babeliales bacterium]|nr:transketolase [Candidatus Babeliales bacterium]
MKIENKKIRELQARALQLRIDSIRSTTASASGHPTTCLSAADIISALFFEGMNFDLENPQEKNNDRFILSKGHGIPVVYAAYKQLGVLSDEELMQLRQFESPLEGHPTSRFIHNEAATGSLGQGLAIGAGMALQAKQDSFEYKTYVLLGDGELAEGSVWEAAAFASHESLNNLIGIVDCNRLGQSNQTLYGHDIDSIVKRFESFGWQVISVDGHDIEQLLSALATAKQAKDKPVMIIAKTFKGYGVDEFEDKNGFHGKPVKKEELESVLASLRERFAGVSLESLDTHASRALGTSGNKVSSQNDKQKVASSAPLVSSDLQGKLYREISSATTISIDLTQDPNHKFFASNQTIATRKAFGYALAALGRASKNIVALDADVKNSTYTDIFEKEFSERFIQCFIAEQTMVGVATGLQVRGKIPFVATFGAFLTRAHDQIRMAGVGKNALRICGSHCGVSIGQDGPSQMALEDIAMMRSIPDSIVLYPSDGISTYKLTECMANC